MMSANSRMMILVCVLVPAVGWPNFTEGNLHAAAPVIKDFSSAGGRTQNKTNAQDAMYLVKPGDKITFTVNADSVNKYVWQVNKKAEKATAGNSFTWTVPKAKGIWEIHVIARGADDDAHQEWVVSTLSKDEAPSYFDYFTDKRYSKREQTDPWGRPLPEWGVQTITAKWTDRQKKPGEHKKPPEKLSALDTSCCFVQSTLHSPNPDYPPRLLTRLIGPKHGIEFGTWKFRFRFPNGKTAMKGGKTYLKVFADNKGSPGSPFSYGVACDGSQTFSIGANKFDDDEKFPVDKDWHEATLIRTAEDQLYCYIDGIFKFRGKSVRKHHKRAVRIKVGLARFRPDRYPRDAVYFDNIEVHKGKYLFPTNRVELSRLKGPPGQGHRIIVGGRDVSLKEIAETIKNPDLFSYDPAKKQAVCSTYIIVNGGADMVLNGETLKFERTGRLAPPGIVIRSNATLRADNSNIVGACVGLDNPFGMCLTDTHLASMHGLFKVTVPAMAMGRWEFNRVTITGQGRPVDTEFILTGDTTRLNVYNSDFGGGNVKAMGRSKDRQATGSSTPETTEEEDADIRIIPTGKTRPWTITLGPGDNDSRLKKVFVREPDTAPSKDGNSKPDAPTLVGKDIATPDDEDVNPGTLGLVNCKFGNLNASNGTGIAPKYYLNIRVVDIKGRPIKGAKVTIHNDVDDFSFPAENRKESQPHSWDTSVYANRKVIPRFISYTTKRTTLTGDDGHTPKPKDAGNTIILSDFVRDESGSEEFSYTITIEKGNMKKIITGVNPGPDWYRPDPEKPTYTITAKLVSGTSTVTESELKKTGLAGPVKGDERAKKK